MRSHTSGSKRLSPDEGHRSTHSHSSRDHHHPSSGSPTPSPPPKRSNNSDHRYRDEPYPMPPYYPPYDYPDYGRPPPPPPYPPRFLRPPFRKKRMRHLESDKRTKVHTIFMFNLSYKLTDNKLKEFCSKYGEVSELIYPLSKLGMGFVTYYDLRDAVKAVKEMNGIDLNGRTLHTNFAYRPPAHSKRKPEDICSNVFVKIESIQNKLQSLRDAYSNKSKNQENVSEEEDEIDKEMSRCVSEVNITSDDIQSVLSNYGDIRDIEDYDYGIFLVKFYDIRSARKCVEAQSNEIKSEKIIFEYAPEAEIGDDETNAEFTQEEYYRQLREGGDEPNSDNANNSYDEDDEKRDKDSKSRSNYDGDDRIRNRDKDLDNDHKRKDHRYMPQYHRSTPGGRRGYGPMGWYPPYPPYGPYGPPPPPYPPHPMGWYPPYSGPRMPPPPMRKDTKGGRYGDFSKRKD